MGHFYTKTGATLLSPTRVGVMLLTTQPVAVPPRVKSEGIKVVGSILSINFKSNLRFWEGMPILAGLV